MQEARWIILTHSLVYHDPHVPALQAISVLFISQSLDAAQHGADLPWDLPGPVQCSQGTDPPNPIQAQDTDMRNFFKILSHIF